MRNRTTKKDYSLMKDWAIRYDLKKDIEVLKNIDLEKLNRREAIAAAVAINNLLKDLEK